MKSDPDGDPDIDIMNVLSTASQIQAMVAVVTGGEPLSRPDRAIKLIEGLAAQGKAVVLDTSGMGDLKSLIPILKLYSVHVRVSIDSIIGNENDRWRPLRTIYNPGKNKPVEAAISAIQKCLESGLKVSVQSVIHKDNQDLETLRHLRDWLVSQGVRQWVLHMIVKGGAARRTIRGHSKRQTGRNLVPTDNRNAAETMKNLVRETQKSGIMIDIRCTDTANTPNSVFLVSTRGDLLTEGYAHHGKVRLYKAGIGRPDLLDSIWPHFDRFGHARRYLNWNPWFYEDTSLENLCRPVYIPDLVSGDTKVARVVENEAKYTVADPKLLDSILRRAGYVQGKKVKQRDEYFDTLDKAISRIDYVLRMRIAKPRIQFGFKGPRSFSQSGQYSRIEVEIEAKSEVSVRRDMQRQGLEPTWFFEKKRVKYQHPLGGATVEIDEIPEIGFFVEFEGTPEEINNVVTLLSSALGSVEMRNYQEIFLAYAIQKGRNEEEIQGAQF